MEIEIEDISAKELFNKFDSWNKDIEKTFKDTKREGKKNKDYYKLKDLLVKFNKFPTPIKDLELIDIKLGSKIKEDDVFLEKDFIAEHLRRGESLFYNKAEDTYDYARLGLPKFFDYKKVYNENDNKLKERVLGKLIEVSNREKDNENLKFLAYLTTKVNGENFQVSFNTKYDCWVIASKNVSLAARNKEDIEFYKNESNFESYIQDDFGIELMNEKEKKKKENKEKKQEKKKKKKERLERRKKGKEEEDDDNEENANTINIEENKKNDKKSKALKSILDRYQFAIDFAETWFKILQEKIICSQNTNLINEFKTELGNHTLIGESVGDKKREHILVYKERDIIFYGIVNNQKLLTQNCIPLSTSFNLFKKYNLSYTEISPSQKFNTLEELYSYINEQYDVIFDKSLQESGEGNVVYFTCDINDNESVKGLGKLKTFEYRFFRKIREKCKGVPPKVDRKEIEKDISKTIEARKKKDKKKKEKNKEEEEKEREKEIIKINKKIDNEIKEKNEEREKRINNLIHKMKSESRDLLKEVPKSKYNTDKILLTEYFDLGEYIINYRAQDDTNYADVFASFIEIMREKFKSKTQINEALINEIRKKFEGLISIQETNEDNEDEKEEDPKE